MLTRTRSRVTPPPALRWIVLLTVFAMLTAACTAETGDTTTTSESQVETTPPPTDTETTEGESTETTEGSSESGGDVTIASALGVPQLDPHRAALIFETTIWRLLWDPLTTYTLDGGTELGGALAESWEASEDLTQWTFILREDLRFNNGDPLTADDIKANLDRVADPETGFFLQFVFDNIVEARVVDDRTIEVELASPRATFPEDLSKVMIVDVDSLDVINENPVGTGKYMVEEFVPDDRLVLVPNPEHWDTPAPLDSITYVRAADTSSALTSLGAGDIDVLYEPPWQNIENIEADPDLEVLTFGEAPPTILHLMMDVTSPPFDNPVARRAMAHAVDRQTILDAIYAGKGLPANTNSPIQSGSPWFNDDLPTFEYDLEEASRLFAEAGINEGDTITYWTTPAITEFTPIGEVLQANLAQIGIQLDIQEVEIGEWISLFVPRGKSWPNTIIPNFYTVFPAPEILELWDGFCECNYDSEEFRSLLAEAQSTTDEQARMEAYDAAQAVFVEDLPVVVVQYFSVPVAVAPGVTNIWYEPGGYVQFHNMTTTE